MPLIALTLIDRKTVLINTDHIVSVCTSPSGQHREVQVTAQYQRAADAPVKQEEFYVMESLDTILIKERSAWAEIMKRDE